MESQRTTRFLLGLVLVLALVFAAFEYTTHDVSDSFAADVVDDLPTDEEMLPPTAPPDAVPLLPKRSKAEAVKVTVVDNNSETVEMPPIDNAGKTDGTIDDGTGGAEEDEATNAMSPVATGTDGNPLNFHVVEDLPQFPGGAVEFMKWLTKNLRYPSSVQQQKVEGKVVVQFIINRDGSVSGLKIVQALHPECDREALRVMRMMPKWKPGIQHDKPCRTMVRIPIVFKL